MRRPRLGFLGTGWIGRHRLQAIVAADCADVVGIADSIPDNAAAAAESAPRAAVVPDMDALFDLGLDGVVIATPSALHAAQAMAALERGIAVFCQKPLGRDAAEVRAVVAAARRADRLLGLDLSYRHTEGLRRIRALARSGALGRVFAADLVFHNAYGPNKPWFYDRAQSGGGCLTDLGVHLVDLALWLFDDAQVMAASGQLFAAGTPLGCDPDSVEDYAAATITLSTGAIVRLACSWRLHAGQDADIGVALYGTAGGAAFRNLNGSFYDFVAQRFSGTARETLATPPDDWGGRAAIDWAERLAGSARFAPEAEAYVAGAELLDRLYGRSSA